MAKQDLEITTKDGVAKTGLFRSASSPSKAGVILYMDAFGPRPALDQMAERLAGEGYAVLVPDLFYRNAPYGPFDAKTAFVVEETKAALMALSSGTTQGMTISDGEAFLDALAAEGVTGPVGVVGYCMGGARALNAAASYPDRIRASPASMAATWRAMPLKAHTARLRPSRPESMSALPASTAAFRRSSRRDWPRRCAWRKSTTPSRTMPAWRMAGVCRITVSLTRPAPSATGSG
jgi:carboxymethylenebutenolidase